jgi:S-adenosylmethionine:tRNA ribosyltransferase-isomerase
MTVHFALEPDLEAHQPPEARGLRRDEVRMLVGRRRTTEVSHHRFADLATLLDPGDVLVVNTSATMPAAVDVSPDFTLHVSTELPSGDWAVELRTGHGDKRPTTPYSGGVSGQVLALPGAGTATLLWPYTHRLWVARLDVWPWASVAAYLHGHGHPIRYGYVPQEWPISAYQTVFSSERHPGMQSAEMPSAGRPFTTELVTRLVSSGIVVTPITLHTGVSSPEAHEPPYPERYVVPESTARLINSAHAGGSRVIAIGTTVARALESAAGPDRVYASSGWTDLVITPERGVRAVDALLTGLHDPHASHLSMLTAIAGARLLDVCYAEAIRAAYLWHEFGDVNLLLA